MNRIAIVADTFYPDKNSAASLIAEIINELSNKNEIILFCASSIGLESYQSIKVYSVPSVKSKNMYSRFLKEHILPIKLLIKFLQSNEKKFDKVIVYSPSIFLATFGYLIVRQKKDFTLLLRDIFPDWAISIGFINNRLLIKYLHFIKKVQFDLAGKIAIQSPNDKNLIPSKYRSKLRVVKNWGSFKKNCFNNRNSKQILYLGNLGLAQDSKRVISLLQSSLQDKKVIFYGKANLNSNELTDYIVQKEEADENIIFHDQYFAGLVSLSELLPNNNIPGKVIKYLEYGLPILLIDKPESYIGELIEKYEVGKLVTDVESYRKAINWVSNLDNDISENCKLILSKEFSKKNIYAL